MAKGAITASTGPILPDVVARDVMTPISAEASIAAEPGPSSQTSVAKKRRFNTLDGYVDQAMTEAQKKAEADLKFFRFIVHSNSAFLLAHNPYLLAWIQSLRPTYVVPSRYVLSGKLLQAENSRVHIDEVQWLNGRKRVTLLFDGWEDKLRQSLYGTVGVGMDEYRAS
ncbi:hypothetical protein FB451DRAFT_1184022 [Mycena latifolia]|nr:hypothetical protein FB451DRAFT_1184022 [Mycena latifolia]